MRGNGLLLRCASFAKRFSYSLFLFCLFIFTSAFFFEGERSFVGVEKKQQSVLESAKKFLSSLQLDEPKEAWTDTSKEFKEEAHLSKFLDMLEKYPFLTKGNYELASIDLADDYAEITVLFEKDGKLSRVFLYMSRQEDAWQVWGIRVEDKLLGAMKALDLSKGFDEAPFQKSVEAFLDLIKSGQKEQAYENYTTKEFKTSTTSSNFAIFFQKYPFLIEAIPDWQPIRFQGNDAYYLVFFTYSDKQIYPAEFQLVKEDGIWKVEALKIFKLRGR